MRSKFALVPKAGTGSTTFDAFRPQLQPGDNSFTVICAVGNNHYLVKLRQDKHDANDNRTIADTDEADQSIDDKVLPANVRSRIVTWLNSNGYSNKVADFNANITTYKQLLLFFIKTIANQNVNETDLLSGYQTNHVITR